MNKTLEILSEYNIWNGEYLPEGYRRIQYMEKIKSFMNNRVIKVLIGQRRAGKSYILRQVINLLHRELSVNEVNIFYLNKEQLVFDEITDYKKLDELFRAYLDYFKPKGKVYIFLDEIQTISEWEKFVVSYSQDTRHDYEIFITGSNSQLLSTELSTLLSGRYVEISVFPYSFTEYCEFTGKEPDKTSFTEYIKVGGLPELLNFDGFEPRMHYVESVKNAIILRDIIERHKIKDTALLEMILKYIILNTGNMTSVNSIVKYFRSTGRRVNYETVSDYIHFLTQALIAHSAERYHIKNKQILKQERKFYLNDLSFRNFLYGETYFNPAASLENYVYLSLLRKGYRVFVGILNNGEIDFIAHYGNKVLYFQVAYLIESEDTMARETGNLLRIQDNYPKYLVTMDDVHFGNIQGISHVQAWQLEHYHGV